MIFPAYQDTRENRIRLSNELHKFNYENIPLESFVIPNEWDNEHKNIEMIFFPDVAKPQLTETYFQVIKTMLSPCLE